jgi:hypothetical protein
VCGDNSLHSKIDYVSKAPSEQVSRVMVRMSVKLQGQIEKSDEPNLMEFDIKILSCLDAIAVHKLLQHGIIVLGIVTCDMTNLNQNMCEARVSQGTLAAGLQDTLTL